MGGPSALNFLIVGPSGSIHTLKLPCAPVKKSTPSVVGSKVLVVRVALDVVSSCLIQNMQLAPPFVQSYGAPVTAQRLNLEVSISSLSPALRNMRTAFPI